MRVTAKDGDDDHWWHNFVKPPSVYLDGVEQRDVTEADDIKGYIVRVMLDRAGNLVIDDDKVVYEKLHGVVEIFGIRQPWAE